MKQQLRENFYRISIADAGLKKLDGVNLVNGASFNSYLLILPENNNVLFNTVPASYSAEFLTTLREIADISSIKYIVLSSASPTLSGAVPELLAVAPSAKILASAEAASFLSKIHHRDFPVEAVFDDQIFKLSGTKLKFISVPFMNWPDTIYTCIDSLKILVSGNAYSAAGADAGFSIEALHEYFNSSIAPYKTHASYASGKLKAFDVAEIAPAHGAFISSAADALAAYEKWTCSPDSAAHAKAQLLCLTYSSFGFTEELADAVLRGFSASVDADVKRISIDDSSDAEKIIAEINSADGLLIGSSGFNGDLPKKLSQIIMGISPQDNSGKAAAVVSSYGWSSEAADMLAARLNVLKFDTVEPALKAEFKPDEDKLSEAAVFGRRLAVKLASSWKKRSSPRKMSWLCTICGEVFDGALPPGKCPVCGAGREAFVEFTPGMVSYRKNEKLKVVIIGSGAAAVAAADALRTRNRRATIDIYTRENVLPYFRPVLTKGLGEKLSEREYFIKQPQFYEEKRIGLHLGAEAVSIDVQNKTLAFKDGSSVQYEKLLIATGARCFVPPIKGSDLPEVITLREETDFEKLKSILDKSSKRVAVIGGGLLGLETAYSLCKMGHNVSVMEVAPCLLPRQLDRDAASILESAIRRNCNVKYRCGVTVTGINGDEHVRSITLHNGEELDVDLVIISAGIRSNTDLASAAGIKVDRGILVDSAMRTSVPDIYAAGDCAVLNGKTDGIWESALDQGRTAGANMAGDASEFRPKLFGAALNAFRTQLFSIGEINPDSLDDIELVTMRNDINLSAQKLVFRNSILKGGILVGDVSRTSMLLKAVTDAYDKEKASEIKLF